VIVDAGCYELVIGVLKIGFGIMRKIVVGLCVSESRTFVGYVRFMQVLVLNEVVCAGF
jgi:hypothetical protein